MTGESAIHENAAGTRRNGHVSGPERGLKDGRFACLRRHVSCPSPPPRGQGQIIAAGRCRVRLAARNAPSE
ncbi:hypothetical protein C3Y91_01610 [Rhizobium sp. UPM1133]|nr:hypothetical protein [Rhizobium ruizarguesonis]